MPKRKTLQEEIVLHVVNDEENPFAIRETALPTLAESDLHVYGKNKHICATDARGYKVPKNTDPNKLVVDASNGFIPLWDEHVNLRWRFSSSVDLFFKNPEAFKTEIRNLLAKAIQDWGDAAPVTFSERTDAWDFEITIKPDECSNYGCVYASAFFPDSGRHELVIHPKYFTQPKVEQKETLIHELGHIFGLRHFFALIKEKQYPSVKFGDHQPFSIMNYNAESVLTAADKADLKKLYQQVWKGELTKIDGAKIQKFKSYHQVGGI